MLPRVARGHDFPVSDDTHQPGTNAYGHWRRRWGGGLASVPRPLRCAAEGRSLTCRRSWPGRCARAPIRRRTRAGRTTECLPARRLRARSGPRPRSLPLPSWDCARCQDDLLPDTWTICHPASVMPGELPLPRTRPGYRQAHQPNERLPRLWPSGDSRARTGILRCVRVRGYKVEDLRHGAAAD